MNDDDLPRLLSDDTADPLVRRLLGAGVSDAPSPRALRAAPAAVAALIVTHAAAGSAVAASSSAGISAIVLAKWLGAGALLGTSLSVLAPALTTSNPPPRPTVSAPSAHPRGTEVVPAPPRAPIDVPPPAVAADAPPSARAVPPPPSLAREVALLDAARGALDASDATRALASLASLDRLPQRALVPEATVLRVRALLLRGDTGEARRVARRFIEAAPSSPQAAVLREIVGDLGKGDPR